ncbi:MAG: putative lipid II flippase FtsW [Clostridia bacterium]|nr:putative lipid II flippase FtsW [Clostridia bacterium]
MQDNKNNNTAIQNNTGSQPQRKKGNPQISRTLRTDSSRKAAPVRTLKLTRIVGEVDRPFLIILIVLVCIGSVMVFSASYPSAESRFGDSFYYARRQIGFVLAGIVAMALTTVLADYRLLKRVSLALFMFALALNAATAVPGIGLEKNGARRWLNIGIDFQPSEILKFALILMCARHISDNYDKMRSFKTGTLPFVFLLCMSAATTVMQSHLSCTIILCIIVFALMWMGGTNKKLLFGAVGVGAAGILLVLKNMAHSIQRVQVWLNPLSDLNGAGWQPLQSLYAIAAGGFWGLGLGQSNQKHGFLPEPHNDYIFAILCEELGYFGAFVVMFLFALLVWRGYVIAKKAPNMYASLIVMGIMCSLAAHVLLNIAVVTNSIPSTGIGLPFFSYGGTSLMIWMAEMGVVLSVSRYSYLEKE